MNTKTPGFTLIEMLVVVAILSLLATMAVTGSIAAKERAKNSRTTAELGQVRIQAVGIKNDTYSFSNLCDTGVLNVTDYNNTLGLLDQDVFIRTGEHIICYAGEDDYCIKARMAPSGYICMDSTGYIGSAPDNCEGTHFDCANP